MAGIGISWLFWPSTTILGSALIPCLMIILGLSVIALSAFGTFATRGEPARGLSLVGLDPSTAECFKGMEKNKRDFEAEPFISSGCR